MTSLSVRPHMPTPSCDFKLANDGQDNAGATALPGSQKYPAHGSLYRAFARPRLLEGLTADHRAEPRWRSKGNFSAVASFRMRAHLPPVVRRSPRRCKSRGGNFPCAPRPAIHSRALPVIRQRLFPAPIAIVSRHLAQLAFVGFLCRLARALLVRNQGLHNHDIVTSNAMLGTKLR
jgi:hypothetical protein